MKLDESVPTHTGLPCESSQAAAEGPGWAPSHQLPGLGPYKAPAVSAEGSAPTVTSPQAVRPPEPDARPAPALRQGVYVSCVSEDAEPHVYSSAATVFPASHTHST